nr:MAG TPA: hypothetical protein [Caudoviricetes sp.]
MQNPGRPLFLLDLESIYPYYNLPFPKRKHFLVNLRPPLASPFKERWHDRRS